MILHGGLRGAALPPLFVADRSFVGKLLIDDAEIDQLRIDAIRRCDAVVSNLASLDQKPAKLSHVLSGPEGIRKLLLETVDFDAADAVEKAAARLEKLLGPEGVVADPRPEFIGSSLTMGNVRLMVEGMQQLIAPYRAMLAQLKVGKW